MEINYSLNQIDEVAEKVMAQKPHKIILFIGAMGAGKTTLIKALSKALGVYSPTSSPTFSLVNEYEANGGNLVYHFDVYRLKNEAEAYDMGIDEYLYSGQWCFIEWAEKIENLIPIERSIITIENLPNGQRKLTFE